MYLRNLFFECFEFLNCLGRCVEQPAWGSLRFGVCDLCGELEPKRKVPGHEEPKSEEKASRWNCENTTQGGRAQKHLSCPNLMDREVQLDLTPAIEVLYMLFEGCHTKNRKISIIKQHIKCFNFRSKIQLDHPVEYVPRARVRVRDMQMSEINGMGPWGVKDWGETWQWQGAR